MGFKGPRKMRVIIPGMHENDERVVIQPKSVSIMFWILVNQFFLINCNIRFLLFDIHYHLKIWGLKDFLCFMLSMNDNTVKFYYNLK